MNIEYYDRGIYLPEIRLWLDNTEPDYPLSGAPSEAAIPDTAMNCAATWISHGHSDHARGCHQTVIGTSFSLRFYRMRLWMTQDFEPEKLALNFGESMSWNGATLTCYPAGHILGAAQLLIEYRGERVLYTGDFKLRKPLCGNEAQLLRCDTLIVESTFGLPIYKLLSREAAASRIVTFAQKCLEESSIPAFIGYALGRGQEIAHILCQAGIPTAVHGAIAKFIPVYEEAGYSFPGWEPYDARATAGKALVVVPSHGAALEARGKNVRLAYVSGWAALANARARTGAEELIPYSDHADFDELLEAVETSGATAIDVVHGYTRPFAHILQRRGFNAQAPVRAGARTNVEEAEG